MGRFGGLPSGLQPGRTGHRRDRVGDAADSADRRRPPGTRGPAGPMAGGRRPRHPGHRGDRIRRALPGARGGDAAPGLGAGARRTGRRALRRHRGMGARRRDGADAALRDPLAAAGPADTRGADRRDHPLRDGTATRRAGGARGRPAGRAGLDAHLVRLAGGAGARHRGLSRHRVGTAAIGRRRHRPVALGRARDPGRGRGRRRRHRGVGTGQSGQPGCHGALGGVVPAAAAPAVRHDAADHLDAIPTHRDRDDRGGARRPVGLGGDARAAAAAGASGPRPARGIRRCRRLGGA